MTFCLQNADILQARTIADRALKTINFREEDEKYNIWMAWLNLEYKFGTSESLDKVYQQAINESKVRIY